MTNDVRLGAAEPTKPTLMTEVITKRRTRDGSNQPASWAMRGAALFRIQQRPLRWVNVGVVNE